MSTVSKIWRFRFLLAFATFALSTYAEVPEGTGPRLVSGAKLLNPEISVNGLFALSQFNTASPMTFDGGHDPHGNGIEVQNLELTFGSAIDPYFRGDSNIVINPDGKVEIEEAYATSLDFPWDLQLKAGTFLTGFGRLNASHPHTWNTVNKPLVLGRMFGGDGLRNPGLQASWLTPLPWYSEMLCSIQTSTGDTAVSFLGPNNTMRGIGDSMLLLRSNNFISISDENSLNFGASWVTGPNSTASQSRSNIVGADLYYKFRRPNTLSFVALQIEALKRFYETPSVSFNDWGAYAELSYRISQPFERWVIGARFDYVGSKAPIVETSTIAGSAVSDGSNLSVRSRYSLFTTFYPSEFSKIRLQYDFDNPRASKSPQQMVALQFEFMMGAHGAHKF